jgi:hypothetical protein
MGRPDAPLVSADDRPVVPLRGGAGHLLVGPEPGRCCRVFPVDGAASSPPFACVRESNTQLCSGAADQKHHGHRLSLDRGADASLLPRRQPRLLRRRIGCRGWGSAGRRSVAPVPALDRADPWPPPSAFEFGQFAGGHQCARAELAFLTRAFEGADASRVRDPAGRTRAAESWSHEEEASATRLVTCRIGSALQSRARSSPRDWWRPPRPRRPGGAGRDPVRPAARAGR